jgi:hypothetical protein
MSPSAIPDPPDFNVTATAQADPTQAAAAGCTISAGGPGVNQATQTAPVKLGTSGGNVLDTSGGFCCSGTLGSLVTRNGVDFILSNNHVLAKSDKGRIGPPGDAISQPGLVDTHPACNAGLTQTVANLSQFVNLEKTMTAPGPPPTFTAPADAALAQIVSGQVDTTGAILQLGVVSGGLAQPAPPANTTVAPVIGMPVAKSGRTSGLTCSTIAAINVNVEVGYDAACGSSATAFNVIYSNQIDIFSTTFSAPGDSGSLIVEAQTAEPVGLLYAGSDTDTVANPIQDVLNALPDPVNPNKATPTFVGGATHTVMACTGNVSPGGPGGQNAVTFARPSDAEVTRAAAAKNNHADALMKDPAVIGVGVSAGDAPGEAAVVVFVDKTKSHGPIPATLDGVKTKIRAVKRFRALTSCPAAGSERQTGNSLP